MRRPDLADLERGIRDFQSSSATAVVDSASHYEQRILRNLEDLVQRERDAGDAMRAVSRARLVALLGLDAAADQLDAELCRRLAAGQIDESSEALMRHLRAEAIARLEIDNPRYWSLAAAHARAQS
jgi:hypothetical protein